MPEIYNSKEYKDFLKLVGGNETEAQAAVWDALENGSSICNVVRRLGAIWPLREVGNPVLLVARGL